MTKHTWCKICQKITYHYNMSKIGYTWKCLVCGCCNKKYIEC